MQNQRTAPNKIDFSDLPDLPEADKLFVFGILEGKTASDALRGSRDCSNMQPNTIWVEASRLRHSPKVSLWLSAAKIAGMERALLTKDQWIKMMLAKSEKAERDGNHGASIQAATKVGEALGHLKDVVELTVNQGDTEAELRKLLPADIADLLINEAIGNSSKPN